MDGCVCGCIYVECAGVSECMRRSCYKKKHKIKWQRQKCFIKIICNRQKRGAKTDDMQGYAVCLCVDGVNRTDKQAETEFN